MAFSVEKSEEIGGAALVSLPAFNAFVSILDNYARLELLVNLQSRLPSFLFNPFLVLACL